MKEPVSKQFIAIDLKSFYASVECMDRGLDPLRTNLVVADPTRTEKTICLAVSPSLKSYGIPGRPRLFEVVQRVKEVNLGRGPRSGRTAGSLRAASSGAGTPGSPARAASNPAASSVTGTPGPLAHRASAPAASFVVGTSGSPARRASNPAASSVAGTSGPPARVTSAPAASSAASSDGPEHGRVHYFDEDPAPLFDISDGSSCMATDLSANTALAVSYIVAPPRMRRYMDVSTQIFDIYLRYVSEEDVHVYSVDEVFIDATPYLHNYGLSAHDLAIRMIQAVLAETGITATAGIGTNMYLAKIAMDIVAKRMPPDKDGVRLAELDEMSYRRQLWEHTPITDFWRVGGGIARRLAKYGIYTMGDIARCSIGAPEDFYNEELLYKQFGVNAELLIDHAWGWEPCEIKDIKAFRPENNSLSQGQVLSQPYAVDKARIVVREMTEMLSLDLVVKKVMTDQMVLTVCYDRESLADPELAAAYEGEISTDRYGRRVPKDAHGSINLDGFTSSTRQMAEAVWELFDRIVDPRLLVRRIYVVANHITRERDVERQPAVEQLSLFEDFETKTECRQAREEQRRREHALQEAVISIKNKYGKNAIIKGTNLEEGATGMERNRQVGGHKA